MIRLNQKNPKLLVLPVTITQKANPYCDCASCCKKPDESSNLINDNQLINKNKLKFSYQDFPFLDDSEFISLGRIAYYIPPYKVYGGKP